MKKIFTLVLLSASLAATAQQGAVISFGGGINNPSAALKDKSYLGNGYQVQGDVFVPVAGKGKFVPGILVSGNYFTAKGLTPDAAHLKAAYKLYNGELDIASSKNGSGSKGFAGTVGLQLNIALGMFRLSPALSAGYMSYKNPGFAQRSAVTGPNGTSQGITLFEQPEQRKTGFMAVPQLRLSYPVAGPLSVYAAAALNIGPAADVMQRKLEPAGGFNEKHTYETQQLTAGKMTDEPVSIRYQAMTVNAGLSWSLGGSSRRLRGKVTKPGDNGMMHQNPLYDQSGNSGNNPLHGSSALARPGSPIGGIVVKGGKNPGGNMMVVSGNDMGEFELNGLEKGSYRFVLEIPGAGQGRSISEKGVKRQAAVEGGVRAYTGGRKNELARPGNPIGGIIVKGGKNPGGGMTNLKVDGNGTIEFEVLEAGDYRFRVEGAATGSQNKTKGKKVVEKATSGLKDTLKTNV